MAFSLADLHKGRTILPPRMGLYGVDKIGKTTMASQAPSPIFIPTEDGQAALDVDAFPLCTSHEEVVSCIQSLITEDHEYKTAILDSADWTEKLLWRKLVEEANDPKIKTIEQVGGGYGKGYVAANDLWRTLLTGFNKLRTDKGMAIILIAHSTVKKFDDPMSESYDRYELAMHKHMAALMREWVDVLGFATQKATVRSEDAGFGKKVGKAIELGSEHVLHLRRTPSFDAGNRYGLPAEIPLNWSAFADAFAEAHK